ncbi:MAG: Na+/H+ antiporter NhaA [Actinomycetota bacterium]|nr:Na+/H+ antiporter NhaA [Actinomycetota bacterium]
MPATRIFPPRLERAERRAVVEALHDETTGGLLLLVAATVALVWANVFGDAYAAVRHTVVGPAALHLDLTLEQWAADGLLAVFFLVAGLELKRELVVGELRHVGEAVVPIAAALCGMAVPALVYVVVAAGRPDLLRGWAIPTATDIAFALAVLAVIGSSLPTSLRAFLLTLAVVDDLGAITVIAVFYTESVHAGPLAAAVVLLAVYALLQHRRVTAWWVTVPLGVAVWALVHEAGVHATVAGVLIGLLTRVRRDAGEHESPAERLEHRLRPLSAGLCVPLFAVLAAGVSISGNALRETLADPAAVGVVAGLLVGKTVGVLGGAYVTARFTRAQLSPDLEWADVLGVAVLSGIGFTVALLIGDLAFAGEPEQIERVKTGILAGSLLAAVFAAAILRVRNAKYRSSAEEGFDEASEPEPSTT